MLFHDVNDKKGGGQTVQVGDRAEVLFELLAFAFDLQFFALRQALVRVAGHHLVNVGHLADGLADGREVGQHTAGPTFGHVRHAHLSHQFLHDVLGLFLGGDEEDALVGAGQLAQCSSSLVHLGLRLIKVNDVDAVALHKDIRRHVRIPFSFQVSEVTSCIQ